MVVLSGCQTMPTYSYKKETQSATVLALPSSKEMGVVRFNAYQTPKDEPLATGYLLLAAIGGANIHYPVHASVFDVTDEMRYVGTTMVDTRTLYGGWLEHEVPAGKRIFMLTLAGGPSNIYAPALGGAHADFVEIDVKPNSVHHVALTRHGFNRYPYFNELLIDEKYLDYCLHQMPKGSMREQYEIMDRRMKELGIDPDARDYRGYCVKLAGAKYVHVKDEVSLKQFSEGKGKLEAIRKESFPEWKEKGEKLPPYNLMKTFPNSR